MSDRFLIIGNGVAGITAAFTLRQRHPRAQISVISGESDYFISRTALMYAYMDQLALRDLEPFERKAYDRQNIQRLRAWVTGLDATRQLVTLDNGLELPYDALLLATGSVPNRAPWAGVDAVREGLVHFVSLQHLAECERLTPTTRRAAVVGGGLIGVELVECLLHHGIEVDFLVRDAWYWPMALAREEGELIASRIRHHGVHLHLEHEVASVAADATGRVASITTNQGTTLPCQMLGVAIGVRPGVDWLRQVATPPELGRGIRVNAQFQTSLPHVYAAGDCAEFTRPDGSAQVEQIWYSAKRQGEAAARAMLGDAVQYQPPLFFNSAKFFDIEYTTVGDVTRLPATATSLFCQFPGPAASLRIIENQGAVIGFNALGTRWNHNVFETWIHQRKSLPDIVPHLRDAQFDVEFGRAPLAPVTAAFAAWQQQVQA